MAQRIGLHVMPLDDPAAQQRKGGHAQSAREEVLDHRKGVEGIRAQERNIGVEIASRGIEVFVRKMCVIGEQVGGELHRLTAYRRPFARLGDESIGRDGQRLAWLAQVPFSHHETSLGTEMGWARA